jgi:hypothetical protein
MISALAIKAIRKKIIPMTKPAGSSTKMTIISEMPIGIDTGKNLINNMPLIKPVNSFSKIKNKINPSHTKCMRRIYFVDYIYSSPQLCPKHGNPIFQAG